MRTLDCLQSWHILFSSDIYYCVRTEIVSEVGTGTQKGNNPLLELVVKLGHSENLGTYWLCCPSNWVTCKNTMESICYLYFERSHNKLLMTYLKLKEQIVVLHEIIYFFIDVPKIVEHFLTGSYACYLQLVILHSDWNMRI